MTDKKTGLDVSRRKLLAGLGTVGIASAGAGLGTTAFLNDTESFTDNVLTAGELNLIVDYWTDVDQGSATPMDPMQMGRVDGEPVEGVGYTYEVTDVKPGDSGTLAFCPYIVDNPAWLWIGSEEGLTDFENGQTEPEAAVDGSGGDPGAGNGELSQNTMVTVEYAYGGVTVEEGEIVCSDAVELKNDDPYTLADLGHDLGHGFPIDPDRETEGVQPYPASAEAGDQQGPCICIHWEVPTDVGNEIQTDSIEMDFQFVAEQSRHNPDGGNETANPFGGGH